MAERMARLRLEAINAFEAADYSLALDKIDAMRIIYDTTPNQEKDSLRIEWRSIEQLTQRIEVRIHRSSSHGKLMRSPISYGRTTGSSSCTGSCDCEV